MYTPPHSGGEWGEFWKNSPPPEMAWGGATPPQDSPHSGGEHAAGENFEDFGPKTLCFNRDFELIRKIGMLPPTVGGSLGGEFLGLRGGVGGALPPMGNRAT